MNKYLPLLATTLALSACHDGKKLEEKKQAEQKSAAPKVTNLFLDMAPDDESLGNGIMQNFLASHNEAKLSVRVNGEYRQKSVPAKTSDGQLRDITEFLQTMGDMVKKTKTFTKKKTPPKKLIGQIDNLEDGVSFTCSAKPTTGKGMSSGYICGRFEDYHNRHNSTPRKRTPQKKLAHV